jgi:hypothetical protein
MKGIYLTEEGKKAIEDKIAELEPFYRTASQVGVIMEKIGWEIEYLKEILSSATILPTHENWEKCVHYTLVPFFENDLPNGVIIEQKNKQQ